MVTVVCCTFKWFHSQVFVDGLWIGGLWLFELAATGCPGFLDCHLVLIFCFITTLAHFTLVLRSLLEWTILALSLVAASSASRCFSNASKSWIDHCRSKSENLLIKSIWLTAMLALAWSSGKSIVGLLLQLMYATAVGESWEGLLSTEPSISITLPWEEVSNGHAGTSDWCGREASALVLGSFATVECSSSVMPQSSSVLTSSIR